MVGLWVAGLASFSLPHFPVLKRRKATRLRQGIIRTADHKSLYDKELNLIVTKVATIITKIKSTISRLVNSPPEDLPGFVIPSPSARLASTPTLSWPGV
jgi:hypothetical protein